MKTTSVFLKLFAVVVMSFGLLQTAQAEQPRDVVVVGYLFPPFVNDEKSGLTQDLIALLNQAQSQYRFVFRMTSPARRYQELSDRGGDVIFFEMPRWGWEKVKPRVLASRVLYRGGEVYVALQKGQRDQSYFDDIADKRIAAISGYHYGFAGYNADPVWLNEKFKINLSTDHETNLRALLGGRVDITVMTLAYLLQYQTRNPDIAGKILVSDRRDQVYDLRVLARKDGAISIEAVENILLNLRASGALDQLFQSNGLARNLVFQ